MIDYSKSKIYKIESIHYDKVYVGSTVQPLSKRLYGHKRDMKCYENGKYHYVTSFEVLAYKDVDIFLIENYPCNSKEELHAREGYWVKELDCVNKVIPARTKKQYRHDNKEKIKVCKKQYYEDNSEKIKAYNKRYREANVDKIKARNKQYCDNNSEKIKAYNKQYNQDNADRIKALRSQKVTCVCGSVISLRNKARHELSKKHQAFVTK